MKRRHASIKPSNTCSFSFSDAIMPGKPFASSDTRGKINRITKANISVTPATSSSATSGRGMCSASSLRAAGPNMTPTTKAATTGSMTSRPAIENEADCN